MDHVYLDINECTEGTHHCDQTCTNSIGSYSCSCGSSYRLATNGLSCTDIDECAEGTNGCAQNCTNTVGNYTCSCGYGYRLASDGQTCNGKFVDLVDDHLICTVHCVLKILYRYR